MSPSPDNPVGALRAFVGDSAAKLGRAALTRAGGLALTGVTRGLQLWEASGELRATATRYADQALNLAAHTPLGRLLPEPSFGDDAADEARRFAAALRDLDTEPDETAPLTEPDGTAPVAEAPAPVRAATPAAAPPPAAVDDVPARTDLPIADFDGITLGSLRARLRSLSLADLGALRAYEAAHGHRLPVLTLLDNRIAKLEAAAPSPPA